jgi:predicted RNA-binding protein YlqC (UPF0109 family)
VHVRELMVFNNHVGRIIGKRGLTITDIQQRSGARVDIPQHCERGTAMRKIRVFGTAEQVISFEHLLLSLSQLSLHLDGSPFFVCTCFNRFLTRHLIMHLQVEYCAVLVQLQLPNQTEMEITRLQHEVAALQSRHSASLALRVVEVPMEHVGRIIGRHGQYLRQLKETTGATVTLPRFSMNGAPPTHQIFTIMGNVDEVDACEGVLRGKLHECVTTPPPHAGSGGHSGGRRTRDQAAENSGGRPARQAFIVEVPNEHVGRVIGKGGAAIRELQRQTGAKVYLPSESGAPCREMQILGTTEQRRKCYAMLIEKVPYLEQATTYTATLPQEQSQSHHGSWTAESPEHMYMHGHDGLEHGSPTMHTSPSHLQYSPIVYDEHGYEAYAPAMYPQSMVYQPGMQMQPHMGMHMYPDGGYHPMAGHSFDEHGVAISPSYEWATSPVQPMYHPEMDMAMMQQQHAAAAAAAAGVMLSPSHMMAGVSPHEVLLESPPPPAPQMDESVVEAPMAQQRSAPTTAWGKPGPIPQGQSQWPDVASDK